MPSHNYELRGADKSFFANACPSNSSHAIRFSHGTPAKSVVNVKDIEGRILQATQQWNTTAISEHGTAVKIKTHVSRNFGKFLDGPTLTQAHIDRLDTDAWDVRLRLFGNDPDKRGTLNILRGVAKHFPALVNTAREGELKQQAREAGRKILEQMSKLCAEVEIQPQKYALRADDKILQKDMVELVFQHAPDFFEDSKELADVLLNVIKRAGSIHDSASNQDNDAQGQIVRGLKENLHRYPAETMIELAANITPQHIDSFSPNPPAGHSNPVKVTKAYQAAKNMLCQRPSTQKRMIDFLLTEVRKHPGMTVEKRGEYFARIRINVEKHDYLHPYRRSFTKIFTKLARDDKQALNAAYKRLADQSQTWSTN